jgi:hypothetical protein
VRFFRGNRFALIFFVLLIFCSAMVVLQFMANQSRHDELRENFILLYLYTEGRYPAESKRLYDRLLLELETMTNKELMDDYQRTLMLVDAATPQQTNLIWKYHWSVSNELGKRRERVHERPPSEAALQRALKMAEEEKK